MSIVYIYDFDGVLNKNLREELNQDVIKLLIKQIKSNNIVAINTGRSFEELEYIGLGKFFNDNISEREFNKLIIVAEKGAVKIVFKNKKPIVSIVGDSLKNQNGLIGEVIQSIRNVEIDPKIKLKTTIKHSFLSFAFYPKHHSALDEDLLNSIKNSFESEIIKILQNKNLEDRVLIDKTTIAIDIQPISHGKKAASKVIKEWLKENKIKLSKILCFGDSLSDLEMLTPFKEENYFSSFVWTGNYKIGKSLINNENFVLASTEDICYDQATLAFLRK